MTLRLDTVTAGYLKDAPVITNVSLEVPTSTITTVLGPNGSGKSTLLRTIMGHLPYGRGSIHVDGVPIDDRPVHKRVIDHRLAFVPQLANVFGPLTVLEN